MSDTSKKAKRERVKAAAEKARARAEEALESGKASARRAADKAGETVQTNPLLVLGGGLLVGAVLGALVPATDRERKLVGGAGRQIRGRAGDAVQAAKAAGVGKLAEVGLNSDALRNQFKDLLSRAGEAAKAAGTAAADTAKAGK